MTQAAWSHCRDQVQRFDNDRFICAAYAPPARRDGLIALYAFNLEVARIREQVREPLLAQIRLQWWRDALEAIAAGSAPGHPVATALAETMQSFTLDATRLQRFLDGRARDLDDAAPADLSELETYADATAGNLSAVALQVLGVEGETPAAAMRHVAVAWALVGLMRAVPFHAQSRRAYLPATLNRRAGLDLHALFEEGETPGLTEVVEQVAARATEHLCRARSMRGSIPRAALPAMLIATFGDHYLARLRQSGFNPFQTPAQQRGRPAMLRIAVNATLGRF